MIDFPPFDKAPAIIQPAPDGYLKNKSGLFVKDEKRNKSAMMCGLFTSLQHHGTFFSTDFSEYATGAAPGDWWMPSTTNTAPLVQTKSGSISGKALELVSTNTTSPVFLWSKIPYVSDCEILMRVQFETNVNATNDIFFTVHRLTDRNNFYEFGFWNSGASTNTKDMAKVVGGTSSVIFSGTQNLTTAIATWYYVRTRLVGSTMSISYWKTGTTDPGFLFSGTDTSITSAGATGLRMLPTTAQNMWIDYFACSIVPSTIPVPV